MSREIRKKFQEFVGKEISARFDPRSETWVLHTKTEENLNALITDVNDDCLILKIGKDTSYIPFSSIGTVWV
jgi:hypothetical protein